MEQQSVPGFTADTKLQAKLDSLDNGLEPLEPKEDKKQDENKQPDTSQTDSEAASEDTAQPETSPEEEGYTIDEDNEESESDSQQETPARTEAEPRQQLTPEQQYILDGLSPITVRGRVGDGEVQEFKVLDPVQLPNGFKYIDDREQSVANKAFTKLEETATHRQAEFRQQEQLKTSNEFVEREKQADRSDIGRLQREGEIPKFKTKADSKEFEADPAVQLVQEILDFKDKMNDRYADEYKSGRPYKHIGFVEAHRLYKHENPDKFIDKAQAKEDGERKNLARRTAGTTSAATNTTQKSKVHSGMSSRDLDLLLEEETASW